MNEEREPSLAEPKPRSVAFAVAKALGCITGGVGLGFLAVVLVLGWLLFDVAPRLLEFVANLFGS